MESTACSPVRTTGGTIDDPVSFVETRGNAVAAVSFVVVDVDVTG
jgi:hypothetical protein